VVNEHHVVGPPEVGVAGICASRPRRGQLVRQISNLVGRDIGRQGEKFPMILHHDRPAEQDRPQGRVAVPRRLKNVQRRA